MEVRPRMKASTEDYGKQTLSWDEKGISGEVKVQCGLELERSGVSNRLRYRQGLWGQQSCGKEC